jgi:hypothetical protein
LFSKKEKINKKQDIHRILEQGVKGKKKSLLYTR